MSSTEMLNADLQSLIELSVTAIESSIGEEITVRFSNSTYIRSSYWRLISSGTSISSFDHNQVYGLQNPIDAISIVREALRGKKVIFARAELESGDLVFEFEGHATFEMFNFSANEVWEIEFAGRGLYLSNYFFT